MSDPVSKYFLRPARHCSSYNEVQTLALEKRFDESRYIENPEKQELADKLGITAFMVELWFAHRRFFFEQWEKNFESSAKRQQEYIEMERRQLLEDEAKRQAEAFNRELKAPVRPKNDGGCKKKRFGKK
ncbi:unnamed protein product [Caenorhabditis auriculariae]|uniref:Homeobox domain-containing protein n=1 Tax=Caenorhabditis auriculariae TaxID=2777116 RepID=A0A8S1HIM3_9PELO|nr:unnamed protein product [Caenorhabditis auriculariae]